MGVTLVNNSVEGVAGLDTSFFKLISWAIVILLQNPSSESNFVKANLKSRDDKKYVSKVFNKGKSTLISSSLPVELFIIESHVLRV